LTEAGLCLSLRRRANVAAVFRLLGIQAMPKPYSDDLRDRVIVAAEAGASRREAAESFNLSPSSAVKWLQRRRDTGSAKAKPSGGSALPLEEHANWLLAVVTEQPDLPLDEIVAAMRKRRIPGSRTAMWRFLLDMISPSKNSVRAAEQQRPDVARACLTRPGWCLR
jgi:transposase